MANVTINIFGMTAVLSRGTRTMAKKDSIGDYEVMEIKTVKLVDNPTLRPLLLNIALTQYL